MAQNRNIDKKGTEAERRKKGKCLPKSNLYFLRIIDYSDEKFLNRQQRSQFRLIDSGYLS